MSKMGAEERAERRNRQTELAEELKATGALDEVFARIDAGEPLTGDGGVLGGMLKAALERGLEAELSEHVGYEKGAPDATEHPNSDRKSTRLNSSHVAISYAVFCLKKKIYNNIS